MELPTEAAERTLRMRTILGHLSPARAGGSAAPTAAAAQPAAAAFPTPQQREQFATQGYVIVDDACRPDLVHELLSAGRRIRDRVLDGSLQHGFIHRNAAGNPWGIRGALLAAGGTSICWHPYLCPAGASQQIDTFPDGQALSPQHGEPVFGDYLGHAELTRYIAGFTLSQRVGLGSVTVRQEILSTHVVLHAGSAA